MDCTGSGWSSYVIRLAGGSGRSGVGRGVGTTDEIGAGGSAVGRETCSRSGR